MPQTAVITTGVSILVRGQPLNVVGPEGCPREERLDMLTINGNLITMSRERLLIFNT